MADLYSLLIPLTERLKAIDLEIEKVSAPLLEKRAQIQAEIATIAARITEGKVVGAGGIPSGEAFGTPMIVHEPPTAPIPHIPRRRIKLLKLLRDQPNADFTSLTRAMYDGKDDRPQRGALSSEFSNLKADGLVVPTSEKGKFKLTQLARRALAQQENGAGGR